MGRYKVLIKTGSGKNLCKMGSIALPNKKRVCDYVNRNPLGNYKTKIKVTDLLKRVSMMESKSYFSRKNWKWK